VPRKKKEEEHENLERWLISYADFITLLFAFFVIMYAMSSLNVGKYKILAESLNDAFQNASLAKTSPSEGEDRASDLEKKTKYFAVNNTLNNPQNMDTYSESMPLEVLSRELRRAYKGFIEDGRIQVRDNQDWVEIVIQSSLLFYTGDASLNIEAQQLLIGLANFLSKISNPITVEGYTDNVEISSRLYPSNWELSSARASSVTRALIEGGVVPIRLAATGYASNFPVANNDNSEGRARNRRVILLVEKNDKRRSYLEQISKDSDALPDTLPVGAPNMPTDKNPVPTIAPVTEGIETPSSTPSSSDPKKQ
jgi:chemotaxis protein MotB